MKKKYYIEISSKEIECDPPYLMQSKWFDTKKEAIDWYRNNFDYTSGLIDVKLMCAEFDENDEYDDIGCIKILN